jgi:hypothetical protein
MDRDDARRQALLDYTEGRVTRFVAMQRLGFTWYGQLLDAMSAAGLRMHVPAEAEARMRASMEQLFGNRLAPEQRAAPMRRHPAAAAIALAGMCSSVRRRRCRRTTLAAEQAHGGIRFGLMRGQMVIPADFDAPLPADVLSTFTAAITPATQHPSSLLDDDNPSGREEW